MGVGRTAGKGKAAEEPAETKPSQVQKLDEVAISSELGDLDSLDPDVAKGVKAVVKQLVGHANKQQEVIDSLRVGAKKRDVQDENTASLQKRIDTVEGAHPDAVKLTMTKSFTEWLDKSPLANRVFTTSEEPQAIIDVISEYKKANPPATTTSAAEVKPAIEDEDPKVKARREAAETIVSKGKKAETSPPRSLGEEEGFNQGWDDPEFADEDKTRKSEGRVW